MKSDGTTSRAIVNQSPQKTNDMGQTILPSEINTISSTSASNNNDDTISNDDRCSTLLLQDRAYHANENGQSSSVPDDGTGVVMTKSVNDNIQHSQSSSRIRKNVNTNGLSPSSTADTSRTTSNGFPEQPQIQLQKQPQHVQQQQLLQQQQLRDQYHRQRLAAAAEAAKSSMASSVVTTNRTTSSNTHSIRQNQPQHQQQGNSKTYHRSYSANNTNNVHKNRMRSSTPTSTRTNLASSYLSSNPHPRISGGTTSRHDMNDITRRRIAANIKGITKQQPTISNSPGGVVISLSKLIRWIGIFFVLWFLTNLLLYYKVSNNRSYYVMRKNYSVSSSSDAVSASFTELIDFFHQLSTNAKTTLTTTKQQRRQLQQLFLQNNRTATCSNDDNRNIDNNESNNSTNHNTTTATIDIARLYATLPFDNIDGGVWKQGWELHPIFNILANLTTTNMTVTNITDVKEEYDKDVQEPSVLQIFVVPHTHIDPDLTASFDTKGATATDAKVKVILENVIHSLMENSNRTFIWSEIGLLQQYFDSTIATTKSTTAINFEYQSNLRALIKNKQFELVSGSITSLDEAITSYYSNEMALQDGLIWINTTFGVDALPRYIWSIGGPLGYSSTLATNLYSGTYHYNGIVLQHVHYSLKKYLARNKLLEFMWQQSEQYSYNYNNMTQTNELLLKSYLEDDSMRQQDQEQQHPYDEIVEEAIRRNRRLQEKQSRDHVQQLQQYCKNSIVAHVMPFYSYDIPHTCGPDPSICCQYDFELLEARKVDSKLRNKRVCPWGIDPVLINDDNIKEKSLLLLDQYLKKASLFRYNTLLIPLGGDMKYSINSDFVYESYERIFSYINTNVPNIRIQFGTLSTYFDAMISAKKQQQQIRKEARQQERKQQQLQPQEKEVDDDNSTDKSSSMSMPIISGSFFPFADRDDEYATNYYTQSLLHRSITTRLERCLHVAEILGASASDDSIRMPRRTLALFQHHDMIRSVSPRNKGFLEFQHKIVNAIELVNGWIKNRFIRLLRQDEMYLDVVSIGTLDELNKTMTYCGSYSDLMYAEPNTDFLCGRNGNDLIVYNPLQTEQMVCNDVMIESGEFVKVRVPCRSTPKSYSIQQHGNQTHAGKNYLNATPSILLKFRNATGLLSFPIQEEWKNCIVDKGEGIGNYVPRELQEYDVRHQDIKLEINDARHIVRTPNWNRTLIEYERIRIDETMITATVIDFYYQTKAVSVTVEAISVRFGDAGIENNKTIFTDINGLAFETHKYRSDHDLPFLSQIAPMSSMAYIQDNYKRLTVISEHGHGAMSSDDGFIDIFINNGLIGKVGARTDSIISTRLRIVIEEYDRTRSSSFGFKETSAITSFVRQKWEEVQHPLEFYGKRLPIVVPKAAATPDKRGPPVGPTYRTETIGMNKFNQTNTIVPFVFMVYNRVGYLQQVIQSLRDSDFPTKDVPIIISQDGHVQEMSDYVETLKTEFKVIQLFHPYACHDNAQSFPGGNDTGLNIGYKGDTYGHPREAGVTCCKHHFAWLMQQVFSLDAKQLYGADTRRDISNDDTFFFSEEDYLLGPTIYRTIMSGLNAMEKYGKQTRKGAGFFGLTFEPKLRSYKNAQNTWYAYAFTTGPMTMNRGIFHQILESADQFCYFDDYNWDWSLVNVQNQQRVPYTVLATSEYVVKHIGVEGGMHSDMAKKKQQKENFELSAKFDGTLFAGSPNVNPNKSRRCYGGWGHPMDRSHCMKVLGTTDVENEH